MSCSWPPKLLPRQVGLTTVGCRSEMRLLQGPFNRHIVGHLGGVVPIVSNRPKVDAALDGAEIFCLKCLAEVFGCPGSVPEVFQVPREWTLGLFGTDSAI